MEAKFQYNLLKAVSEFETNLVEKIVAQLLEQLATQDLPSSREELLTDKQLCELLQISTSHFYQTKKKHKSTFPVYDIGGAKRYKISEVESFFHKPKSK